MKSKLQRYQIHLPGRTHIPIGTSTDQNKKKRPLQERIPRQHKPTVQWQSHHTQVLQAEDKGAGAAKIR